MDARLSENETLANPDPKADTTHRPAKEAKASPGQADHTPRNDGVNPVQAPEAGTSSAITAKLAKLEEQLKGIGKTLTLHMGKEEVLTRSLVELELKINTLEKSLLEKVRAESSSRMPFEKIADKTDSGVPQTGSAADTTEQIPQPGKSFLPRAESHDPSEQWEPAPDFTSPALSVEEEGSSFFAETPGFEASPESEHLLPEHEPVTRSRNERRKSILIISVLCLLALFLFLLYYYNKLQKQADQKLTITEKISLSSVPVDTGADQPAQIKPPVQAETKPEVTDTPGPSPVSIPPIEANDEGTPSTIPQEKTVAGPGGFSVSVGSFKEKSNAIALTSKLTKKGYPAQMAQLQQKKLFRVTVGTFASRSEAMAMASRLQKKEQLQTAIIDFRKP